tara:strand:+ start:1740 stop:2744 length:1005 start_codon:yes stop_codon:yes gene_type:complete
MKKREINIIAEIGSVHDGSIGNAINLIKLAKKCGASHVKFQTHIAENETRIDAPNSKYFNNESRYEYFQRTSFSLQQWKLLKKECDKNNIIFLSSPFSIEAVNLLEKIKCPIYKIASGEVNNIPLLEHIAKTKKQVFLSSGMSNFKELDRAVNILKKNTKLSVFQCSSIYPCPPNDVGLNLLKELEERYKCPTGFSDHTQGNVASIAAVTLGANFIEKHLTFSKEMYGSDAQYAMEPKSFKELCYSLKELEKMINTKIDKDNIKKYKEMRVVFQKSIVARKELKKGKIIMYKDLAFKKPGNGIPPGEYKKIIGSKLIRNLNKDEIIKKKDYRKI